MSESYQPKQVLNLHVPYSSDLYVTGNISCGGTSGSVGFSSITADTLTVNGTTTTDNLAVTGESVLTGNLDVGGDLNLFGNVASNSGTVIIEGNLQTTGDVIVDGFLKSTSGTSFFSNNLEVQGNIVATGTITGDIIGFKVYKSGDWSIADTSGSILQYTNIDSGNAWNSYDTNGGWNSTLGLYEVPKTGYWNFTFSARPKDDKINAMIPLVYDTEANFMVADSDHAVWIAQDDSTVKRSFSTYTTTIKCTRGDWVYARPFDSNNWLYAEMSGWFIGS